MMSSLVMVRSLGWRVECSCSSLLCCLLSPLLLTGGGDTQTEGGSIGHIALPPPSSLTHSPQQISLINICWQHVAWVIIGRHFFVYFVNKKVPISLS